MKGGRNGEPRQVPRAESTRLKPSSQGHRKRERTGERRAFWAEETACAKALRHRKGLVWLVREHLRSWCDLKVRKGRRQATQGEPC